MDETASVPAGHGQTGDGQVGDGRTSGGPAGGDDVAADAVAYLRTLGAEEMEHPGASNG